MGLILVSFNYNLINFIFSFDGQNSISRKMLSAKHFSISTPSIDSIKIMYKVFDESKIKISANPMREAILRTQARCAIGKIHRSSSDALLNIRIDPGN